MNILKEIEDLLEEYNNQIERIDSINDKLLKYKDEEENSNSLLKQLNDACSERDRAKFAIKRLIIIW